MKKEFEKPEINFVSVNSDIITASGCVSGGDHDLPFVPDP